MTYDEALLEERKPNSWSQTYLSCSKTITATEMCQTRDGTIKKCAYVTFLESVEPGVKCVECVEGSG